jgi:hypothetical protein
MELDDGLGVEDLMSPEERALVDASTSTLEQLEFIDEQLCFRGSCGEFEERTGEKAEELKRQRAELDADIGYTFSARDVYEELDRRRSFERVMDRDD